ncbi:unnamed protein product [Ambrosiozyma monospora]|uniref:Unnamed protein product n=1 Tax=Ambrosiozyma monospora TaxID=43982 RepID=A0A9W6YR64_AMBMO|nr:unnamed protein product [Ambrosiozyma monospora]
MNSPEYSRQPSTPPAESNPMFSPPISNTNSHKPATYHYQHQKLHHTKTPKSQRHHRSSFTMLSPKTPRHQTFKQKMSLKTPTSYHQQQQQLQTPEPTPRVPQQRRKELSEAISFDSTSSSSSTLLGNPTPQTLTYNSSLLFPVAHSTIGSGRRVGYSKPDSDFIKLDVKKSRLIVTKQDDESMSSAVSSDDESDDESAPVAVQLRKVSKQLDFSVCMEEEEDEFLQVPA